MPLKLHKDHFCLHLPGLGHYLNPLCCIFSQHVSPVCSGSTFFQRCILRRVPENRVSGLTNLLPEGSLCAQDVWLNTLPGSQPHLKTLPLSYHWQAFLRSYNSNQLCFHRIAVIKSCLLTNVLYTCHENVGSELDLQPKCNITSLVLFLRAV